MWKLTTIALTVLMILWAYIDYRDHPAHPYRLALWISPTLAVLSIIVLLWWEYSRQPR
jgi:hypothetical protein